MAIILDPTAVHRPRNVDWKRAAALLYGDWGTSKAYVIGLAFVAAGFASLPIILAVCVLTAVVAYNYIIVCAHFPGWRRRLFRGAATEPVSGFDRRAPSHREFHRHGRIERVGRRQLSRRSERATRRSPTMGLILVVGAINFFGPKHSGSVSIWLAIPAMIIVALIIASQRPPLEPCNTSSRPTRISGHTWIAFVGVILALSGVEAVANITGVMKLDPDATPERPKVTRTATKAIVPVAIEVVLGTALLGWAMLSLPRNLLPQLAAHKEDMLRFLAEVYGGMAGGLAVGQVLSIIVGIVFGLLLLSAVNTAVVALIGVVYMMAQDGEMPRQLAKLNSHGVPRIPLIAAVAVPIVVLAVTKDFEALAGLYAIGVVGAIAVNLGSCTFNKRLGLPWYQRFIMGATFVVLAAVEVTIAKTKPEALFFAMCVLLARLRVARLLAQGLRPQDHDRRPPGRRNGNARSGRDIDPSPFRRAKNHGGRPRRNAGSRLCARRSAAAESDPLRSLREGNLGLLHRRADESRPRQMAGRSGGERDHVA